MMPSSDPALSGRSAPLLAEDTSATSTHHPSEPSSSSSPSSYCLPTAQEKGRGQEADMENRPPISHLPPELLSKILTFVGLAGGPPALAACLLVCRGFHDVIEDPALDKYIYKSSALSLLSYDPLLFPPPSLSGTRVPPTPSISTSQKQTYKVLARTLFRSPQRFPPAVHDPSMTCVPEVSPTTRSGHNPAPRDNYIHDYFHTACLAENEKLASPLPPLSIDPTGGKVTRVIDFVHSCTEASRSDSDVPYVGVKTCGWSDSLPPGDCTMRQGEAASWVLFSDDPRRFPDTRGERATVQRAAIVGGLPSLEARKRERADRKAAERRRNAPLPRIGSLPLKSPLGLIPLPGSPQKLEARKRARNPFVKPVDNDKFLNAQPWGHPERCINASVYKAFGPQMNRKPGRAPQPQTSKHNTSWFTGDKSDWAMANVSDDSLESFGKSLLHSDANLRLVPRLVNKQLEVAVVERLAMSIIDKGRVTINMAWRMPKSARELSLEPVTSPDEDAWDEVLGEHRTTWEYRSCGDHLIVCDDNSGRRASTISCFSGRVPGVSSKKYPASTSDLRWQRRMIIKPSGSSVEYWLDNDGLAMNSSVCAYATRRHIRPEAGANRTRFRFRAVMEFHIVSLRTGDTIKVLNLAEEERDIDWRCYMWCSLALGDGTLVASVGGLGNVTPSPGDRGLWAHTERRRYGYENLFLWDLGGPEENTPESNPATGAFRGEVGWDVSKTGPASRIPLPPGWGEMDKYVVLSGCGRYLGVTAGWKTAVWDFEERSFVGVWRVSNGEEIDRDTQAHETPDGDCFGWNGVWIKWRDVTCPSPGLAPVEVASGLSFMNSRELRRAIIGVEVEVDRRYPLTTEGQIGFAHASGQATDEGEDADADADEGGSVAGIDGLDWFGGQEAGGGGGYHSGDDFEAAEVGSDGGDVGYMGLGS